MLSKIAGRDFYPIPKPRLRASAHDNPLSDKWQSSALCTEIADLFNRKRVVVRFATTGGLAPTLESAVGTAWIQGKPEFPPRGSPSLLRWGFGDASLSFAPLWGFPRHQKKGIKKNKLHPLETEKSCVGRVKLMKNMNKKVVVYGNKH